MTVKSGKALALAIAIVACLCWTTPARAQCGDSLAFGHITGSWIQGCDDSKPLDGFATIMGSGGTTGTSNIVCESSTEQPQGGALCQVDAGTVGDGKITISGNWANPGSSGCPSSTSQGRNLYFIRDASGGGLILSVGLDPVLGLYEAGDADRLASPSPPGTPTTKLTCLPRGSRQIAVMGINSGIADVELSSPTVFSDCDFDSFGINVNDGSGTGSCDPLTEGPGMTFDATGHIYTTADFCSRGANPTRSVCNGGSRDGQACAGNAECPPFNIGCVPKWVAGPTVDPTTLPARVNVPLPTKICAGVCSNNPTQPCLNDAQCGTGTCSDASAGKPCTTNTDCAGQCTGGTRNGVSCTNTTPSIPACGGVCSNDATRSCTVTGNCVSPGTCTARPCVFGTCTNISAFADMCGYIGTTVGTSANPGVESLSIASLPVAIGGGGPLAPPPKAVDLKAAGSGGNVRIQFRTEAELDLAGFNILTETKAKGEFKVNAAMIPAQGVGGAGHAYDVLIPRGSFQGGKTVIVESVLTTGGPPIRSIPVRY